MFLVKEYENLAYNEHVALSHLLSAGHGLALGYTGQKTLVVNGVVVGPFEEEEEGTGVASDVVKVQGEDQATPGPLP